MPSHFINAGSPKKIPPFNARKIEIFVYFGIFFDGTNNNKVQSMIGKNFRRKEVYEKHEADVKTEYLKNFKKECTGVGSLLSLTRGEAARMNVFTAAELDILYGSAALDASVDTSFDQDTMAQNSTYKYSSARENTSRDDVLKPMSDQTKATSPTTEEEKAIQQGNDTSVGMSFSQGSNATNPAILSSLYQVGKKVEEGKITYRYSLYMEGSGSDNEVGMLQHLKGAVASVEAMGFGYGKLGVASKARRMAEQVSTILEKHQNNKRCEKIHVVFDIFGFSRGATTARLFTYLIDPKDKYTHSKADNNLFMGKDHEKPLIELNDKEHVAPIVDKSVRVLGLYDTVSSIGILHEKVNDLMAEALRLKKVDEVAKCGKSIYHEDNVDDYGLYSTESADNVLHFCAMDENRENFALVDIENSLSNGTEIFMPGCHTDIGGGADLGLDSLKVINRRKFSSLDKTITMIKAIVDILKDPKSAAQKAMDAANEVGDALKKALDDRGILDELKGGINDLVDTYNDVRNTVDEIKEQAEEVKDLINEAKDQAEDLGEEIVSKYEEIKDTVSDPDKLLGVLKNEVNGLTGNAGNIVTNVNKLLDSGKGLSQELGNIVDFVKNPSLDRALDAVFGEGAIFEGAANIVIDAATKAKDFVKDTADEAVDYGKRAKQAALDAKDTIVGIGKDWQNYGETSLQSIQDFGTRTYEGGKKALSDMEDAAEKAWTDTKEEAKGIFTDAKEGYKAIGDHFEEEGKSIIDDMRQGYSDAWNTYTDELSDATDQFSDKMVTTTNTLVDDSKENWDQVKQGYSDAIDKGKERLEAAKDKFVDRTETAIDNLKEGSQEIWDRTKGDLSDTYSQLKDDLGDIKDRTFDRVETAVDDGIQGSKDIFNRMGDEYKETTQTLKDRIEDANDQLVDRLEGAKDHLVERGTEIGENYIHDVKDLGREYKNEVTSAVTDTLDNLNQDVTDFTQGARDIGQTWLDDNRQLADTFANDMRDTMDELGSNLQQWGSESIDTGKQVLNDTVDDIKAFGRDTLQDAQDLGNRAVDRVTTAIDDTGNDFNDLWNDTVSRGEQYGQQVIDGAKDLGNKTVDGAKAYGQGVYNDMNETLDSAKQQITTLVNDTQQEFTTMVDNVSSDIQDVCTQTGRQMESVFKDAGNQLSDTLTDARDQMESTISGACDEVSNILSDTQRQFEALGDGTQAQFEQLYNQAYNRVDTLLGDAQGQMTGIVNNAGNSMQNIANNAGNQFSGLANQASGHAQDMLGHAQQSIEGSVMQARAQVENALTTARSQVEGAMEQGREQLNAIVGEVSQKAGQIQGTISQATVAMQQNLNPAQMLSGQQSQMFGMLDKLRTDGNKLASNLSQLQSVTQKLGSTSMGGAMSGISGAASSIGGATQSLSKMVGAVSNFRSNPVQSVTSLLGGSSPLKSVGSLFGRGGNPLQKFNGLFGGGSKAALSSAAPSLSNGSATFERLLDATSTRVENMLTNSTSQIETLASQSGSHLQTMAQQLGSQTTQLQNVLQDVPQKFQNLAGKVDSLNLNQLTSQLDQMSGSLKQHGVDRSTVTNLFGQLQQDSKALTSDFSNLLDVSQNAVQQTQQVASNALQGMQQVAGNTLNGMQNIASDTLNGAQGIASNALNSAQNIAGNTVSQLQGVAGDTVSGLQNTLTGTVGRVQDVASNTVTHMQETLQQSASRLGEIGQESASQLQSFAQNTAGRAQDAVTNITSDFQGFADRTIGGAQTFAQDTINNAQSYVSDTLSGGQTFISDTLTNVQATGQRTVDRFGNVVSETGEDLRNFTDTTIGRGQDVVNNFTDRTTDWLQGRADGLTDIATSAQEGFTTSVTDFTSGVQDAANTAITDFGNLTTETVGNMQDHLTEGFDRLGNATTDFADGMINTTTQAASDYYDLANETLGEVTDSVGDYANEMQSTISDAAHDYLDITQRGIQDEMDLLQNSATEIKDAVVDGVSDATNAIVDAGEKSIDIIEQGITDEANLIVDTGKELGSATVDFATESYDAISDTGKELVDVTTTGLSNEMDIIGNAAEGYMTGITDYGESIVNSSEKFVGSVADTTTQGIDRGINLVTDTASSTLNLTAEIGERGVNLVGNTVDRFMGVGEIGVDYVKGVATDAVQTGQGIYEGGKNLAESSVERLDGIVQTGQSLLTELVDGTEKKVSDIKNAIDTAPELLNSLLDEIANADIDKIPVVARFKDCLADAQALGLSIEEFFDQFDPEVFIDDMLDKAKAYFADAIEKAEALRDTVMQIADKAQQIYDTAKALLNRLREGKDKLFGLMRIADAIKNMAQDLSGIFDDTIKSLMHSKDDLETEAFKMLMFDRLQVFFLNAYPMSKPGEENMVPVCPQSMRELGWASSGTRAYNGSTQTGRLSTAILERGLTALLNNTKTIAGDDIENVGIYKYSVPGYSNITLQAMLDYCGAKCTDAFAKPSPEFKVPSELESFYNGIKSKALSTGRYFCVPDDYESYMRLRTKYLHFSANQQIMSFADNLVVNAPTVAMPTEDQGLITRRIYKGKSGKADKDPFYLYSYDSSEDKIKCSIELDEDLFPLADDAATPESLVADDVVDAMDAVDTDDIQKAADEASALKDGQKPGAPPAGDMPATPDKKAGDAESDNADTDAEADADTLTDTAGKYQAKIDEETGLLLFEDTDPDDTKKEYEAVVDPETGMITFVEKQPDADASADPAKDKKSKGNSSKKTDAEKWDEHLANYEATGDEESYDYLTLHQDDVFDENGNRVAGSYSDKFHSDGLSDADRTVASAQACFSDNDDEACDYLSLHEDDVFDENGNRVAGSYSDKFHSDGLSDADRTVASAQACFSDNDDEACDYLSLHHDDEFDANGNRVAGSYSDKFRSDGLSDADRTVASAQACFSDNDSEACDYLSLHEDDVFDENGNRVAGSYSDKFRSDGLSDADRTVASAQACFSDNDDEACDYLSLHHDDEFDANGNRVAGSYSDKFRSDGLSDADRTVASAQACFSDKDDEACDYLSQHENDSYDKNGNRTKDSNSGLTAASPNQSKVNTKSSVTSQEVPADQLMSSQEPSWMAEQRRQEEKYYEDERRKERDKLLNDCINEDEAACNRLQDEFGEAVAAPKHNMLPPRQEMDPFERTDKAKDQYAASLLVECEAGYVDSCDDFDRNISHKPVPKQSGQPDRFSDAYKEQYEDALMLECETMGISESCDNLDRIYGIIPDKDKKPKYRK